MSEPTISNSEPGNGGLLALQVGEVAYDTFLLVSADDHTVGVCDLLDGIPEATHVIVRQRCQGEDAYYLLTRGEIRDRLTGKPAEDSLLAALGLAAATPSPLVDAWADAEKVPERAVVREGGWVIGFIDDGHDASEPQRGPYHGASGSELCPRFLVTELDPSVTLGETVSLLVYLAAWIEDRAGLEVALPAGSPVDVLVRPVRGFVVEGPKDARLVTTNETEGEPFQFRLTATELGAGRVEVLAFHHGFYLGRVVLAPTVRSAQEKASGPRSRWEHPLAPAGGSRADLSVFIFERRVDGQTELEMRLASPDRALDGRRFGPIVLRTEPSSFVSSLFRDLEGLDGRHGEQDAVEERLAAKGAHLFETILPEELQVLLWEMRTRIRSLHVQSDEPWIPWELCRLVGRREDGSIASDGFFCETFAMTRWHLGATTVPTLRFEKIGVIVPAGTDLPSAAQERETVFSLGGHGRIVEMIPATYVGVCRALASGTYTALHFIGHGTVRAAEPDRWTIPLDGYKPLTPADLAGEVANLGRARPLVCLNACHSARQGLALTDLGGWAPRFLRAGAAAFVGPTWAVRDRASHGFARAFYDHLLAGMPIGEAARQARLALRAQSPGDPTWLAYTVFADPLARVTARKDG